MELRIMGSRKDAKYRKARKDLGDCVLSRLCVFAGFCDLAVLCVFARNPTLNPI
jgi:hypothetical protein